MSSKWMKLEDIVECMINADGTHMSKYAEAKRGLCNLRKQEGDEIVLPKLNKWILELLHQMQGNLDDWRLQQRYKNVLSTLGNASGCEAVPAIICAVWEHPDDPSIVASFGFGALKNFHSFCFSGFNKDSFCDDFPSVIINSMICHECDPLIHE